MAKRFTRVVEDFECGRCGALVAGKGYTNHCPRCLWSRHVDVNPGDRQADCRGLMRPIAVESGGGGSVLVHRCEACGKTMRNKTAPNDDFEAILTLARSRSLPR